MARRRVCVFKEIDLVENKELRMDCSLTSAKPFENYNFGGLTVGDPSTVGAQNRK